MKVYGYLQLPIVPEAYKDITADDIQLFATAEERERNSTRSFLVANGIKVLDFEKEI